METEDNKFYLIHDELPDDKDSEYNYEEVPLDETPGFDNDDDLLATVRALQEAAEDKDAQVALEADRTATLTVLEPSVDDFIHSFLLKMKMHRTLSAFQAEWYEMQQKGIISEEDYEEVPDIYVKNKNLDDTLKRTIVERDKYKAAAAKAREMYIKLRNERDFHKINHMRVVQEKNRLITDIKRLKQHYASYEPVLEQLRKKYEVAMKEKMMTQLDRDRLLGQVNSLKSTLQSLGSLKPGGVTLAPEASQVSIHACQKGGSFIVDNEGHGPSQKKLIEARQKAEARKDVDRLPKDFQRYPTDTDFPPDYGYNPKLQGILPPAVHLTRSGGYKESNTIKAHTNGVSSLALHPLKQLVCSTGDDNVWKLWSYPTGDHISTNKGHTAWIADSRFNSSGSRLATCSGDRAVKIWDPDNGECLHTFVEHGQPVWSISWHSCGQFLASASMDKSIKVWDMGSMRCRYTMRGHADSVNSVQFLVYSNTLVTASSDKTIMLWDGRTGLMAHTLYGHEHSINDCIFNAKGDTLASVDSFGYLRLWDVRMRSVVSCLDLGPHPGNACAFDTSSSCLAVASNDGTIKVVELNNLQVTQLAGHTDAVHAVVFDASGEILLSGGNDMTMRIWS